MTNLFNYPANVPIYVIIGRGDQEHDIICACTKDFNEATSIFDRLSYQLLSEDSRSSGSICLYTVDAPVSRVNSSTVFSAYVDFLNESGYFNRIEPLKRCVNIKGRSTTDESTLVS